MIRRPIYCPKRMSTRMSIDWRDYGSGPIAVAKRRRTAAHCTGRGSAAMRQALVQEGQGKAWLSRRNAAKLLPRRGRPYRNNGGILRGGLS